MKFERKCYCVIKKDSDGELLILCDHPEFVQFHPIKEVGGKYRIHTFPNKLLAECKYNEHNGCAVVPILERYEIKTRKNF